MIFVPMRPFASAVSVTSLVTGSTDATLVGSLSSTGQPLTGVPSSCQA